MARRRYLVLLLVGFGMTRGLLVWGAHAKAYLKNSVDPAIYESWATQIVEDGKAPYSGVPIEYPPGVLPAIELPEALRGEHGSYFEPFVLLMLAVDIAAFWALVRLARRVGSQAAPWLWIAGTALLGPLIYLRLDLVPAAATVFAAERLSAGSWGAAAGWLGFGTVAKVYPGFLTPAAAVSSPDRKRFVLGWVVVLGLVLLPFLGVLPDLWHSVIEFHAERGIQTESTWGLAYLVSSRLQGYLLLNLGFGAVHVGTSEEFITKVVAGIASVSVVGGGAYVATKLPRGEAGPLLRLLFAILALLLTVGTVFSPQFVLWLVALAAAAAAFSAGPRWPLLMVLPIAALTHYAFLVIGKLATADYSVIVPLLARNGLVLAAAVGALVSIRWKARSSRGRS